MKINRLFVPLGIVAIILICLAVLLVPDLGIVFAQDSRTATREARRATRTALADQYADAQSTYDAGLARLGSIRITGTANAQASATNRAAGIARATANYIYVSTANAVSDARSTVQAATQLVAAPLTATVEARIHGQRVGAHQTQVAVNAQSAAAIQTQLLANFSGTERATATAQAVRYSTVEARDATSQAKAAGEDRRRNEVWTSEARAYNSSRATNDAAWREIGTSQARRAIANETEQARILTRVARQTAEAGG